MQNTIEQNVMASVGVVYAARSLVSRAALECYVLAAAAVALWQLTWVHRVFQNFFTAENAGPAHAGNYILVALEHAHLAVQVVLVVAAVTALGLCAETLRARRAPHLHPSLLPQR